MLPLQTQLFLREHGLDVLCERFTIRATRHERFPHLVMLKYNQIFSPMAEPVVQQCRGLIVDENDDWNIVSHPFHKFFNAAEPLAAKIDWNSARVLEKLDGSLMSLYFYDGAWHVASSGRPDASGALGSRGVSMEHGFWETWRNLGLQTPSSKFEGWWFGFEFMTPWNQVIVQHETPKIVLIGARKPDGQEVAPDDVPLDWPKVASFPLQNLEDVLRAAELIHPASGEGFVVFDRAFRRVKIKSPGYVALHHMRDQFSISRLVQIVQSGETDEFLSYFPDFRPQFEDVQARFEALIAQVEADYLQIQHIESPRDFAAAAQKTTNSGAIFAVRKGKAASVREFFVKANLAPLIGWLGLKERDAPMEE